MRKSGLGIESISSTRTRRVHVVTLIALSKLQNEAWTTFVCTNPESN